LWDDFVKVFKEAPVDKLIITDIYDVAGREEKRIKRKISSKKLVKVIDQPFVSYLPKEKIISHLKKNLKGREVVIIMGAGDIYKLYKKLAS
jgi:UDP-N-acetylmuramate-alanine ligase